MAEAGNPDVRKKYVIYAPKWARNGGIRALYLLHDALRAQGYDAYVFCPEEHRENYHYIEVIDSKTRKNDIIVYPESICGNPLKFQNVVRYVLYYPGKIGKGETSYHSGETIFTWDPRYYDAPQLFLSAIDRKLFFDEHLPKTQNCYFVHKKGKWRDVKEVEGLVEINMKYPDKREDLAHLLKTTEILYSFDYFSLINTEARLCGATVKIVTEHGFMDYEEGDPYTDNNINGMLDNFIRITQSINYNGDIQNQKINEKVSIYKITIGYYFFKVVNFLYDHDIIKKIERRFECFLKRNGKLGTVL